MLEIDDWNYCGAQRYSNERIIDGYSWLPRDEANDLHSMLRKVKSFRGLDSYTIPGLMEQGGTDHPPLPFLALASKQGNDYLMDPEFFALAHSNLEDNPLAEASKEGHAYKVSWKGQSVYIKNNEFFGWSPHFFIGMHLLENEGVHVSPLLFATQHLFVTKEVKGQLLKHYKKDGELSGEYERRCEIYTDILYEIQEKLIQKKLWFENSYNLDVEIDPKTTNFIIRDFKSNNPLDWFTFIDCVQKFVGQTDNLLTLARKFEIKKYGFSIS